MSLPHSPPPPPPSRYLSLPVSHGVVLYEFIVGVRDIYGLTDYICDIYGLTGSQGVLLYEFMVGWPPFVDDNPMLLFKVFCVIFYFYFPQRGRMASIGSR